MVKSHVTWHVIFLKNQDDAPEKPAAFESLPDLDQTAHIPQKHLPAIKKHESRDKDRAPTN